MLKIIPVILIMFMWSGSTLGAECGIKLGGGGKDSQWIKLKNNKITDVTDVGGPWSFIRETYGPCSFSLFNKYHFSGRKENYGTDIFTTLRIGIKDGISSTFGGTTGGDKEGWKVRSLKIIPQKSMCRIEIQEEDTVNFYQSKFHYARQNFYGPGHFSDIGGWSFVASISGDSNCQYKLYNGPNFDRKFINIEKVDGRYRVGWRIRSIQISDARVIESPKPKSSKSDYSEIKHIKGRCLDVAGGRNQNKTNIQIFDCNGSNSQKWSWTKSKEIKNIMGLCLDVSGGNNVDNTNIQLYKCNGSKSQKWRTISNNRIQNVLGRCLDIVNGIDSNRTNVQLYHCKNTSAQKWR